MREKPSQQAMKTPVTIATIFTALSSADSRDWLRRRSRPAPAHSLPPPPAVTRGPPADKAQKAGSGSCRGAKGEGRRGRRTKVDMGARDEAAQPPPHRLRRTVPVRSQPHSNVAP